jgi:TadE-like protein
MLRQMARAFTLPRIRAVIGQTRRRGVLFWRRVVPAALPRRLNLRRLLADLQDAARRAAGRLRPVPVPVPVEHKERGQTLVEMAIVFPLIFVFIMFVIDFGIALDRREMIQHAVREGARRGAVGDADMVQHTVDQSHGTLVTGDITVCYLDSNGDSNLGNAGDSVRVSADYQYKFTVGGGEMLKAFGAGIPSINMSPSARSRLEEDVPGAAACPQ